MCHPLEFTEVHVITTDLLPQPALIPEDQTPVPEKLGTSIDEADQHLNSPYSDEDLESSFRQPTNADFVMP